MVDELEVVKIFKLDDVFINVKASTSVCYELNEHFSFFVPSYKFHPAYRNKQWDGKIRLFNLNKRVLYLGLWTHLIQFCKDRDYKVEMDSDIFDAQDIDIEEIKTFLDILKLPHEPRENQLRAIHHCIKENRCLLLSPTSSGKSMIIYSLLRWYDLKALLIVPTQNLVLQMQSDFKEYSKNDNSFDVDKKCHTIMAGREKYNKDATVFISTWQSLFRQDESYFKQFDVVIVDECHGCKAKSLISIMEKLKECPYKFGTTGTLDGTETHEMVLTGLFGRVFEADKTSNMMVNKQVSELDIKCLILKYSEEESKSTKKLSYQEEIKHIISSEKRNKIICELANKQKDTTLILFQYLEHGKMIYDEISRISSKPVFYVSGSTKSDDREIVRQLAEEHPGSIIVASSGVYSTGTNIRNLYSIIFASPSKAKIRILQSIGRVLRIGDRGSKVVLYDIVDDLSHKAHKNFALKHFMERIAIYGKEGFNFKLYKILLP